MESIPQFDFITSVDLSLAERSKDTFHFIYGSQLYGTLFGVFGKFNASKGVDGAITFDKMELKLFNYVGVVNIGFSQHEFKYDSVLQIFTFGVMGTSREYDRVFRFSKAIVVAPDSRFHVVFDRILYPLPGFEFDATERNSCDLRELSPKQIPPTDFFDTEFQYRSGVDYFNHALKPGMTGYVEKKTTYSDFVPPYPSPRCSQSNVNFLV